MPIQAIIIAMFAAVFYMLFLITTSIYKDYKNEEYLAKLEEDSQRILEDNLRKESNFYYYQSAQYKDKYAKEELSKLNPGEQMIVFTKTEENIYSVEEEEKQKEIQVLYFSKPKQWTEYFFGFDT